MYGRGRTELGGEEPPPPHSSWNPVSQSSKALLLYAGGPVCLPPALPPTSCPGVIHKPQAMPGHALFPMMNPPRQPQGRIWEALQFSFPDPFTAPGTEGWILSVRLLPLQ